MQGNKSLKLSIWIKKCSKGTKTTTTRYCACHRTLVCAYSQQNKNGSAVQKRQGDAATTNQSSTILSGNHFEIIHSPNPQLQAVFFFFFLKGSFSGPLGNLTLSQPHKFHGDKYSRCWDSEVKVGFVCITDRHLSA